MVRFSVPVKGKALIIAVAVATGTFLVLGTVATAAAEWDTDEARTLIQFYVEQIGDENNKADATDFGTDKDGAKRPAVKALPVAVANESARKFWLKQTLGQGDEHNA